MKNRKIDNLVGQEANFKLKRCTEGKSKKVEDVLKRLNFGMFNGVYKFKPAIITLIEEGNKIHKVKHQRWELEQHSLVHGPDCVTALAPWTGPIPSQTLQTFIRVVLTPDDDDDRMYNLYLHDL